MSLILTSATLYGQWIPLSSHTAQDLYDVHFLNPEYGVAVGDNSTVILTTDGGNTWLPVAEGFKENFRSGLVIGPDSLIIAGGNFFEGSVYRTANGGQKWDYVGQGIDLAGTAAWLYALDNETVFKSPNRGANWKESTIIIGSTTVLQQLYFPSRSTGFTFGNVGGFNTYSTFGFRTTDEGDTWGALFEMDYPNANAFTAAAFPHPDTAFLFTNQFVRFEPGPNNQLWRLTDFKFSTENFFRGWRFRSEVVNDQMPAFITDAAFLDTQTGYATGADGNIYKTVNGGRDWTVDYAGDTPLASIFFPDAVTGFAVGEDGVILKLSIASAVDADPYSSPVRLYPNPGCDQLTIALPTDEPVNGRLFNAAGQAVRQTQISGQGQLLLRGLPPGLYTLLVQSRSGLWREKVIVAEGCK